MTDGGGEFRAAAAHCLTLAQTSTDPGMRASLVAMAQRFLDRANRPPVDIDALLQGPNDQQMTKPLAQQQQQIQQQQAAPR